MQTELTTRELTIHPELQSFLPPLLPEVFAGLEASIVTHGCLSPIVVWGDTIVDGHWRYAICKQHGLPFAVRRKEFECLADAMLWMYDNQCNQRNLERDQKNGSSADSEGFLSDTLMIAPTIIQTNLGTQVRIALDEEAIDDYASAMRRGDAFPPILVFYDTGNDVYVLVDGFHRYYAHQRAKPGERILVKRQYGNLESARWAAIGANKKNSVRRTNEDKKRAVEWALLHACGVQMSNRQIADHVGVDEITVRRARGRLETTATLSQSPERIGRDGRTIHTGNIGKRAEVPSAVSTEKEIDLECSLKKLIACVGSDDAEDFFVKAMDIFCRHNKLDQATATGIRQLLECKSNE